MDRLLLIFAKVHLALAPPADPAPGPSHTRFPEEGPRNLQGIIPGDVFARLSTFDIDVIVLCDHDDSIRASSPLRPMISMNLLA
jgi:hypothetical protein